MAAEVKFVFELQDIIFVDKMGTEGIILAREERVGETGLPYKLYDVLRNFESAYYTEKELMKLNSTSRCRHVWSPDSSDPEKNICLKCTTRKKIEELQ